ncbi:neurogenic locus notch homolog protein 1 isoform X2 [Labeo rohita]|uniref:neurogenic locus notch homolog protein 1 isoform X2 n=1 Tax=Labeo rohita TaxID=84645 RepID=UPI0021E2821C|nr:neurogenic locus notch homolog protein 1 isoform X2 [Labeo rohita]
MCCKFPLWYKTFFDFEDHFSIFNLTEHSLLLVTLDFSQNMGQLPGVSSGKVIILVICFVKISYGNFCTDDVDECRLQPNACQNGGTCLNTCNGYKCICVNGWSGPDCSENIDDCAAEPCTAGSTCIDRVASFVCSCPPGKTGLLCHVDDACISNPCKMGAQCETNPIDGKFICTCPSGYKGRTCVEDIDECVIGTNPCENGGLCINTEGSFTCTCALGPFCTDDVDECRLQPNACQNGGTCHNVHNGYNCVCVNGWSGPDCSENIDDCAAEPCTAGSTCIDRVASFVCSCPPGKTGLLCHVDDACISNPCKMGAQCETNPINGKFICTCPSGYKGKTCAEIDKCVIGPNPCENGGSPVSALQVTPVHTVRHQ